MIKGRGGPWTYTIYHVIPIEASRFVIRFRNDLEFRERYITPISLQGIFALGIKDTQLKFES